MGDSAIVAKSKCFPAKLISSLQRLRYDGKFCDVTIKCADSEFKAHKNVLASATEYFESMFSHDTKEASTGIVDFSHVPTEVVKQCLDFVYTGKVKISAKTVKDVLNLTEMMQLSELARICVAFLAQRISMENCAEMVALSYLHCKESLSVKIGKFLAENFEEFMETEDFYSLEYGCLQHCLSLLQNAASGSMCECEIQKFNGMLSWVSYDLEERKNRFFKLFETMDLSYLSKDSKEAILSQPLVSESNDCLAFIAKYYAADQPCASRKRKSGGQILYFENESQIIVHYDVASDKYLPPITLPCGFSDDGSVIFYKGCIYAGNGQILTRYQLNEGEWKATQSEAQARGFQPTHPGNAAQYRAQVRGFHQTVSGNASPCFSRCVGIGGSVFMVTSHYVYQYTIEDSRVYPHSLRNRLPQKFFMAASQDRIFIMSRCEDCTAFVFDISTGTCSRIKDMPALCSAGLAVWYDQRVFTFCHAQRREGPSPASIVSVYDPKIDTWAPLPDIEVNGIPKSSYITDKLYLTGIKPDDICAEIDLDYLKSMQVQMQRKKYLMINN